MNRACKRLIDFTVALLALVVFSPVMVLTALAIRLAMGRPVLFRQVRPGHREKPFVLVKFRTMREAYGADGAPLPNAQRLTRLGRLLRKTSLDELPQLWNVVRGDMSLVGPRPLLMEYQPYYTHRELLRFTVRPGITGWAQVNGRNQTSWDQRLEHDAWYVEHWSNWLDLKILGLTVLVVFVGRGVVVDPTSVLRKLSQERQPRQAPERDLCHA